MTALGMQQTRLCMSRINFEGTRKDLPLVQLLLLGGSRTPRTLTWIARQRPQACQSVQIAFDTSWPKAPQVLQVQLFPLVQRDLQPVWSNHEQILGIKWSLVIVCLLFANGSSNFTEHCLCACNMIQGNVWQTATQKCFRANSLIWQKFWLENQLKV